MTYSIAVDIGGTFTDLVAYDWASGRLICTKSPTTYGAFSDGILDCFQKGGLSPADASRINHGTTLVINALLQRRGAHAALVTTRGFRDVLEIARANRPDPFDLKYKRDEPLIPRELRFEIGERTNHLGEIVTPVAEPELEALAATLRASAIESVAVFFLNSYANPQGERQAAARLRALLPGVYVTCSVDLTREWYEYERSATVAANAFVGPQVTSYLTHLEEDLTARGFGGQLSLMGSNGGLLSVARACEQPVTLVESGPVGGCIGAAAYAEALALPNVIAFDMGGTTAKCAHIADGQFGVESLYYVGGYRSGFPIRASVLEIVEVGAGGGSIASVDAHGRLSVGPQSAGSTPGPACYGRGGLSPTITDANLVLGRLDPARFLGGDLKLDVAAAHRTIRELADRLGLVGEDAEARMADGVLDLATVIMAHAIRQVSVEQGRDPRDFVLFCYGGGGPLHASARARELSIPEIIIPREPGNFSALGMLLSDVRLDLAATFAGRLEGALTPTLNAKFAELGASVTRTLSREFATDDILLQHFAEMRFVGQRHNIKVAVPPTDDAGVLCEAFRRDYRRRYGHADPGALVEVQALHVSAFVRSRKPDLRALAPQGQGGGASHLRPVYLGRAHGWRETPVHDRASLPPGFSGEGPAIIDEYGSTTLIAPGDRFFIGELGEIRISCLQAGAGAD